MYEAYSTIVFIDANVVLEGKNLAEQDWSDIDSNGPVLVLLVPQVCKEIDSKKRDGRLGKHARAFNRLIAPTAESGQPQVLVQGSLRVDLGLAKTGRIDWNEFGDLDPDEGDARVIAQVVSSPGESLERGIFLSHDINPIAMASRYDLKTKKMPDNWLRAIEPSPYEKEVTRLKGRVRELEAQEPKFEIELVFEAKQPFEHFAFEPLSEWDQDRLVQKILNENPKVPQTTGLAISALGFDDTYDNRYSKFRNQTAPLYARTLHTRFAEMYSQVAFELKLENTGHIQAEDLIVQLSCEDGLLSEKWRIAPATLHAPRPKTNGLLNVARHMPAIQRAPVGRHEVVVASSSERVPEFEIHCADFRHGRVWTFEGICAIHPKLEDPVVIQVEITASNMRGSVKKNFELLHTVTSKKLTEAFDLDSGKILLERPMNRDFEKAIRSENFDKFELIDYDDQ